MSVNLAICSWTEIQEDGFESARIKGALLKRKQALRETCDRMRLLTVEEGKCKVVAKKEPSSVPALRGCREVGPRQQLDLDLGLATEGGASALPECPYPHPSRNPVPGQM